MTIENLRLVLVVILSFMALVLWDTWQRDYPDSPLALSQPPAARPSTPVVRATDGPPLPAVPVAPAPPPAAALSAPSSRAPVTVETDVFSLEINPVGGTFQRLYLRKYPLSESDKKHLFALLDQSATRDFVAQSGIKTDGASADHYAEFHVDSHSYTLSGDAQTLEVPLYWQSPAGVRVTKTLRFQRGSYEVTERFKVENASSEPWKFHHYQQLQRVVVPTGHQLVPTFTGVALSSPANRYEKFDFDKLAEEPLDRTAADGWLAMVEHYFVAALLPAPAAQQHYYSFLIGSDRYVVGYYGPETELAPNGSVVVESRLYLGPKLQDVLPNVAPGLELTVDYGVLWFIAKGLFWTLHQLDLLLGNWGWSIVVLTLLIKLAFFPLSAAGYRSMAKMRVVQPRLLQLRERYGDDKARMNQGMMELYKQEKINPLGGCLPIVVQIPVFISLYWMILESVELRQAPFMFWIQDLSIKDPYYVLPVLMLISMWLQTRMNPTPPDPIQAKVMQIMPLAFGVFFAFFPAGLVLYWLVNNVLSISQQYYVTRQIEAAAAAPTRS
ncbi:MAG: membrane protein insertase YidC [Gammaproteobacteria bacterium]|nr:membrane protein insertase YidC [Gammaproteobacteria bacterium]